MITIIKVSKAEVDAIRANYPRTQIVRTCIQKSNQHTYYAVETRDVMNLLRKMRGGEVRAK